MRALATATLTASTRLIWPAPMASVRLASVKTTVFDFTCAHTRQANRSAVHSSAVGARRVATLGKSPCGHGSCASLTRSRSCISSPPNADRSSVVNQRLSSDPSAVVRVTTRIFGLRASTSRPASPVAGAMTASMNVETIASATATSIGRFTPTMPPNADNGSASRART